MSIQIGEQVIPQINLGVNSLNKIMLGTIEIFPNLAPPTDPEFVKYIAIAPATGNSEIQIPTAGLAVGDTVFIGVRSEGKLAGSASILNYPTPVSLLVSRTSGFGDGIQTYEFIIDDAGMISDGDVFMEFSGGINEYISVGLAIRNINLTTTIGTGNIVNNANLVVTPSSAGNGKTVFVCMACAAGSLSGQQITSLTSSEVIAGAVPLPKVTIAGYVAFQDSAVAITSTQSPIGSGQMMVGCFRTIAAQGN